MKDKTLSQQAYEAIKAKILAKQFEEESYTSENILVKELGMSRTPIREALYQLQNEGLVKIIPRKGVFIQRLSLKETRDYYDLRLAIENHTLKLLRGYLTENDFVFLQKIIDFQFELLKKSNYREWVKEDERFHRYFLSLLDNAVFLDLSTNIRQRAYFEPDPLYRSDYYLESTRQHQQLIDHLKAKRYAEAEETLNEHILRGKRNFV
ncbi:DNA-binding GntR family transcriptional regulator [Providencia alcalifaciens]|nr:DNA-binding GntR family transcriptional regulator [Providencia alcalifaciens]